VAEFVGLTNRVDGEATDGVAHVMRARIPLLPGSPTSGPVTVLVRPEQVQLHPSATGETRVVATSFLGALGRVQLRTSDGTALVAQVTSEEVETLRVGERVTVALRPVPALAVPR
jgi:putative spermidine/putrescine transport system ATP-binding protein